MPRGVPGSGPKKKPTKKATKATKRTYNKRANIETVSAPVVGPTNEMINIELADGTRIENVSVENGMRFIQLLKNQKNGKTAP